MNLIEKLLKVYGDAKSKQQNWNSSWDLILKHVRPQEADVTSTRPIIQGQTRHQTYDSSAEHYNELLASALHSMLTNPSLEFFGMQSRDPELREDIESKLYLQRFVSYIHNILNNSNFHAEAHSLYLDLGSLGTSVFLPLPDDEDIIRFECRPIHRYTVKVGKKKKIDSIFTEEMLSVRNIINEYGEDRLPANKKEEMLKNIEKEYKVIQMLMPTKDMNRLDGRIRVAKEYTSIHFIEEYKAPLKIAYFNTMPYQIPRWMVSSGEDMGRSPSWKAMPNILMLNQMMKDVLRAAQKITDPALQMPDDGFLGPPKTYPGAINFYRGGTNDRIEPIKTGGNPAIGLEMVNEIRSRIKECYYIDQLQLRDGPQMTATEVNARVDEYLRLMGPVLGRLSAEWLQPLIARIIDILKTEGRMLPNMPKQLANAQLEVFFTSQIAKAQRMSEGNNLDRLIVQLGAIAQFDPGVVTVIDLEKILKHAVDNTGVPYDVLRSPEEVAQIRQAQAQQQQAMMAQEQEKMASESEKNFSQAENAGGI